MGGLRQRPRKADRATAYHEAGHVVANWRVKGLKAVGAVSIEPEEDFHGVAISKWMLKGLHPDIEMTDRARARIEDQILTSLAGPAAQRKFKPRSVRHVHGRSDRELAIDLASYVAGSHRQLEAFLKWMWVRAEDLVETNWSTTVDLAATLLERRKLSGRQVQDWLGSWMDAKCGKIEIRSTPDGPEP